jgi:hypothetical protein
MCAFSPGASPRVMLWRTALSVDSKGFHPVSRLYNSVPAEFGLNQNNKGGSSSATALRLSTIAH